MVLVRSYDFIIAKGKRESNTGVFAFFQPVVVYHFFRVGNPKGSVSMEGAGQSPAKHGNVGKAVDMASKMRYNK